MFSVLHVLASAPDFQTERVAGAILQYAGPDFSITTRTIGRGGDYRNWAFAALAGRGKNAPAYDVVHAFDFAALRASPWNGNVLFSPACLPNRYTIRWLATHIRQAVAAVACGSSAERFAYTRHGVPEDACHVVQPGVEHRASGSQRADLRRALGFSDDDHVFLLPGETDRRSGHHQALWAVSILHVLRPNDRVLLWGRGSGVDLLARLAEKLRQPKLLTVAERRLGRPIDFEELPIAADAALCAPNGPIPLLPLATCMTAGLPIVASDSPWLGDLLRDGRSAELAERGTPRLLAQRIVQMRAGNDQSRAILSAAQSETSRRLAVEPFVESYRTIYRKIAERRRDQLARV